MNKADSQFCQSLCSAAFDQQVQSAEPPAAGWAARLIGFGLQHPLKAIAPMQFKGHWMLACAVTVIFCSGCTERDSRITTEMHEDFDHDHKHQHSGDDDHEHEHKGGFKGSHAHGHSHGHRHGKSLYGGRVVSIGHTHHNDGATHFHAEVMPLIDDTIRFHVLTESDDGESKDFPIEATEITGLISIKGSEATAREVTFTAIGEGDTASEFLVEIPEFIRDGEAFSVLIPKVVLDGNRQNFSFSVTRKPAEDAADTADAAQESSDE